MSGPQETIVRFARNPDLQQVEARFSQYAQKAFQKHTHDAYSIGIVKRGRTRFTLYRQTEQTLLVRGGDIVLINPGEVHACNPIEGSVLTYYMLYVEPALLEEIIAQASRPQPGALFFPQPVVRDPALYQALSAVAASLLRSAGRLEVETKLTEALALLLSRCGFEAPPAPAPADARLGQARLRQAYDYLLANLARNVSLRELAEHSGLSVYHFLRAFRDRYGLPPHTCQLQQRIQLARRLLAAGLPIAAVAAEVGFADQSHFTRTFKASVGATPRQYQAGVRGETGLAQQPDAAG